MARKRSPTDRPAQDEEAEAQPPGAAKGSGQPEGAPLSAAADGAGAQDAAPDGTPDGKGAPSPAPAADERPPLELRPLCGEGVRSRNGPAGQFQESGGPLSDEPLRAELEGALKRADDNWAKLQQVAADYANYRKWAERERSEAVLKERSALMCEIIDFMENLERAQEAGKKELPSESALMKGLSMTQDCVRRFLEASGVRPIVAVGRPFDPQCHEAVYFISVPGKPEYSVAEELRRGYTIDGRLLRTSKVSVVSRPKLPEAAGKGGCGGPETPARKT